MNWLISQATAKFIEWLLKYVTNLESIIEDMRYAVNTSQVVSFMKMWFPWYDLYTILTTWINLCFLIWAIGVFLNWIMNIAKSALIAAL